MRIGSDCPVSAKFIDCRKPLSQGSTDTGNHLAVGEETSVKVQLTEEEKPGLDLWMVNSACACKPETCHKLNYIPTQG